MKRPLFSNKRVFITGGARGIGREMAQAVLDKGAFVVVADINAEMAATCAAELEATLPAAQRGKHRTQGVGLDVTDAVAYEDLFARLEHEGAPFDVVIHNAGVATVGFVEDLPLAEWRRVIEVNLFGVVNGVHVAYPKMVARGGGHIINIASLAGLIPFPSGAPYAASKHAVVGLSESLRAEGRKTGVGVTCACPGYIGTDIFASSTYVGVAQEKLLDLVPIRPMSAARCAAKIIAAAERDRGLVVVQAEAKLSALGRRVFPRLYTWGTGIAALRMRKKATTLSPSSTAPALRSAHRDVAGEVENTEPKR